jgi:hypothetical protein
MTGNMGVFSPIHFILMGNTKEHIDRAIESFNIKEMVIFTSSDLISENMPYIRGVVNKGIKVHEIKILEPFKEDCLRTMCAELLNTYDKYSHNSNVTVVSSLTGGTNLMVAAMGLFALIKGIECYYIVKDNDHKIININLFNELHNKRLLDNIELYIIRGV